MKTLLFSLLLLAFAFNLKAQDPNFSQFFASPLTLNPALTGKFDGSYRVAGNYRNQWPTINNAFTTYTASFDIGSRFENAAKAYVGMDMSSHATKSITKSVE